MPRVSVVMPVLNGENSLSKAIDSILAQTFTDWEFLIMNEYGSNERATTLLQEYACKESRIRLLQNEKKLGIAASLNLGIEQAAGDYIARIDADGISYPERLQKQVDFMDKNPTIGICGAWQKHVGKSGRWIHSPPDDPEELAINLLFSCELCHSTVIMRKSTIMQNGLRYDADFAAEDFELWSRAMLVTKLANLPETLGEYYYGDNVTNRKMEKLEKEHGQICAKTIKNFFDLDLSPEAWTLMNTWRNIFFSERDLIKRNEMLQKYKQILCELDRKNEEKQCFSTAKMRKVLRKRWVWARYHILIHVRQVDSLSAVFAPIHAARLRLFAQRMQRAGSPIVLWNKAINQWIR